MDLATLLGIVSGLGLVVGSIMYGGDIGGFYDLPSVLIVVGGTIAVTFIMFPMKTVLGSFKVAMKAFFVKSPDPGEMIKQLASLADVARKQGLVELEKSNPSDAFLKKGVVLVAGGSDEAMVRSILETEINYKKERHKTNQGVFKNMGTMAPAFGMIGTLIGLVQMLKSLNDPSAIGPAMAVALLTTFYGSVLSNIFFLPIAKKLEERTAEEGLYLEIIMEGVLSILNGEHPRLIKEKLESYVAPSQREGE